MLSKLVELPSVLVENIYDFLSDQDALSFRFVCRTLSNDVSHAFKHRFFKTRSFSITKPSLEKFLATCTSVYGSAIREIIIHDKNVPTKGNPWVTIERLQGVLRGDMIGPNERQHQGRILQQETEIVNELKALLLHALRSLNKPLCIRFRFMAPSPPEVAGYFETVILSIAESETQVRELSFNGQAIKLGVFDKFVSSFESISPCLRLVKMLDLNVPCDRIGLKSFVKFMSLIPMVETLRFCLSIVAVRF
jgi:hypothetical protein